VSVSVFVSVFVCLRLCLCLCDATLQIQEEQLVRDETKKIIEMENLLLAQKEPTNETDHSTSSLYKIDESNSVLLSQV
jgi:hypothetical protein